jgi:hypothetical protein
MQKTMRVLTLAGFGMLAGLTLAGTPAQAAPAARQSAASTSAGQPQNPRPDAEVVGYYRNAWSCERAGGVGQRYRAWAHHGCERVRWGSRRGAFALVVAQEDWNDRWDDRWRPGSWPGNWPYRPQWPGEGRPDRADGPGRPDRPGSDDRDRPDRPNRPDRPDVNGADWPSNSGPGGGGNPTSDGPGGWGPHDDRPGSPGGPWGNH